MKFSAQYNWLDISVELREGWKRHPFFVGSGKAAANKKRYSGQPGPTEGMEREAPQAASV